MIKAVRVDHRLLHGQVAFAWTKVLGIDCILIANDAVAKDSLRMSALRLAKPEGVKLVIKSIEDSLTALNSGVTDKYHLFIITESIEDVYRLTQGFDGIKNVNLGGTRIEEGRQQISKAVFVSEQDRERIKEMNDAGIQVSVQMVPDDTAQNAMDLLSS